MFQRVFLISSLILSLAVAVFPNHTCGQDSNRARPSATSYSQSESVRELYVAMMGEIDKPGTYHLDPASLMLNSLLRRAGGFTQDASKVVCVVRRGRLSHKLIVGETSDNQLMAGDLLIAESKNLPTSVSRVVEFRQEPSTTISANYQEQVSKNVVQVALLNVLNYPVVLQLRPGEANARQIIQELGQPITLLANTSVITPDHPRRQSSEAAKQASRLGDGSVMVFEQGKIDRHRLPAGLPKPIESEIAMGAQSGLIGMPQGQSAELRNLGQSIVPKTSDGFATDNESYTSRWPAPTQSQTLAPSLNNPRIERNDPAEPTVNLSRPRIANIPWTGASRITTSSANSTPSNEAAPSDPIPDPDDARSENSEAEMPTAPALKIEPSIGTKSSPLELANLLMICVIVGTLVAAAVLLRRTLEMPTTLPIEASEIVQIPIEPITTSSVAVEAIVAKTVLEQLIKNEVPLEILPVEIPMGIALQGRIAAKPVLRVDGSQDLLKQNGPHFASPNRVNEETVQQEVSAHVDAPVTSPIRRPHFVTARQSAAATSAVADSVADREPIHSRERTQAPLAKALIQLEKGGRS